MSQRVANPDNCQSEIALNLITKKPWVGLIKYNMLNTIEFFWTAVPLIIIKFEPEPPPMLADVSASMWIKKARLPCWPLYSQQVLHERWIWGIARRQESMQVKNPSWLWNPGQISPGIKIGISVAPEKGHVFQNFLKKSSNFILNPDVLWQIYCLLSELPPPVGQNKNTLASLMNNKNVLVIVMLNTLRAILVNSQTQQVYKCTLH